METIIFVWLSLLSLVFIYFGSVVAKLFSIRGRGLKQTIFDALEGNYKNEKKILNLHNNLNKHIEQSLAHYNKTALVRFNPFERIGGEQSYSLAILNQKNDGLVLTFLYTKEGVRAYVKEVFLGKGRGVELSKEEKEAINLANQNKVTN